MRDAVGFAIYEGGAVLFIASGVVLATNWRGLPQRHPFWFFPLPNPFSRLFRQRDLREIAQAHPVGWGRLEVAFGLLIGLAGVLVGFGGSNT